MPFMIPEYTDEPFDLVSNEYGDEYVIPHGYADLIDGETLEPCGPGYFARLTAPGYMDCTDWAGPYDTLEEARAYILETYDVDPDTGEDVSS